MKKLVILLTALAMIAGFSTVSFAVITGSAHDFTDGVGFDSDTWNSSGEICVVCHTPHNADNTSGVLWNHEPTAVSSYNLYDGTATGTAGAVNGKSLLCLSCHDGTVALDSFGGVTTGTLLTGTALVGTDLSNDHPIDVNITTAGPGGDGTGYHTAQTDLPLENNTHVMCASCHDPHNGGSGASLLRISNADSALCLTCHDK